LQGVAAFTAAAAAYNEYFVCICHDSF
jgi:hypothetical protein